jgi:hypothetical protein
MSARLVIQGGRTVQLDAMNKSVARVTRWSQYRDAMTRKALGRWVAVLAAVAFVWTIALSVSPRLHERVHADQSRADHSCAVTFVRSGSCHHSAVPAVTNIADRAGEFGNLPELHSYWVRSPFLSASVFEHGPPPFA